MGRRRRKQLVHSIVKDLWGSEMVIDLIDPAPKLQARQKTKRAPRSLHILSFPVFGQYVFVGRERGG